MQQRIIKKHRVNETKKPSLILYISKGCSHCRSLKSWLKRNNISFVTKSLDDTDVMTELVMRNLVVLSAPALENENTFYLSYQIFDANNRLTSDFKHFLKGEKPQ